MIGHVFKRGLSSIPNHVTEFIAKRSTNQCFDQLFNSKWKLLSSPADSGTCLIELKVDNTLANINKVIHGGALASLVDLATTIALYNTAQRRPGVSVDLNVSFLRPAKLDETILVEGRVVKAGGKIAYLAASIYLKQNESIETKQEALVATGTHTKYIL